MHRLPLVRASVALAALALVGPPAWAQPIYTNSTFTTGTGNGANGTNTSVIGVDPATGTAGSTLGIGHSGAVRIADDFTVPAGQSWTVTGITHFGYVTGTYGNPPASMITSMNISIRDLPPDNPASQILFTSSLIGSNTFTNVHRVTSTTLTNAQRPIFGVRIDFPAVSLPAGTYWMDVGGVNAGFAPPATVFDAADNRAEIVPGNTLQQLTAGGSWAAAVDGGNTVQLTIPFQVEGTVVPIPEPASVLAVTALGLFAARRLRRT